MNSSSLLVPRDSTYPDSTVYMIMPVRIIYPHVHELCMYTCIISLCTYITIVEILIHM